MIKTRLVQPSAFGISKALPELLGSPAAAAGVQSSSLVLGDLAQCHPSGGLSCSLPSREAINPPTMVSLRSPDPENQLKMGLLDPDTSKTRL